MSRQRRDTAYYVEPDVLPREVTSADPQPLYGAKAIAAELDCGLHVIYRIAKTSPEEWEARGIKRPPIRNMPCIGLTADRRALRAWWAETFGAALPSGPSPA